MERWRHAKARLRHAALTRTPVWLSRGRLRDARAVRDFQITRLPIVLPALPDALQGLRIVHLSDLHAGDLVGLEHVEQIVAAANDLEGDLIAVTGDLIDLDHDILPTVLGHLKHLRAPLGVYFVGGNHDYLAGRDDFIQAVNDAGLCLLMNQRVNVPIDGAQITVAGIDYAARNTHLTRYVVQALNSKPRPRPRNSPRPRKRADSAGPPTGARNDASSQSKRSDRSDLRILLSHHPNAFDAAAAAGVDLTLAGHTHGGQVVVSNERGRRGSLGLASLAHRYPKGHFTLGDSHLYVTSGIGSWFPLRVKCPPEIAVLQLQSESP